MILQHRIGFELDFAAPATDVVPFVGDVERSLAYVHFLRGVRVVPGPPTVVEAAIPINAALFGQRELPFRSVLTATSDGARLDALPLEPAGRGWAEVAGQVVVTPAGPGSRARYELVIAVHVALPEADRWGTRALTKMIEYTASTVLAMVASAFPAAVARAAREARLAACDPELVAATD